MLESKKISPKVAEYYKSYKYDRKIIQTQLQGSNFFIDQTYKIVEQIGQGAYGVVAAAIDMSSDKKKNVAIKKIERAFDQRIYTKRTLRQLKLLRLLKHENVIGLEQIILPKSREEFDDIYCVSELMETDLAQILKSDQPLTEDHTQFFIYQLLRGLQFIHSADVIHRDLKPRNLLVNANCDLKICDFGLSRALLESQKKSVELTDYVTTRWYRAPELLLSWPDYTTAVDVWSVGIIFAELLKRKPFLPGNNSSDQLLRIFDIIGTPTDAEIEKIPYEQYRTFIKGLPKRPAKQFEKLFPNASKDAIDMLQKMLTFDFENRITVIQALDHPYLQDLHLPDDEPSREKINELEFQFENYDLTRQQYKDLVYQEILLYHYPDFANDYYNQLKKKESILHHILKNEHQDFIQKDFPDAQKE